MVGSLFEILDLDKDGKLSRADLHAAAKQMGWHWREAPFFAVLDLLSTLEPVSESRFSSFIRKIEEDPLGPYGKVLFESPHYHDDSSPAKRCPGVAQDGSGKAKPSQNAPGPFGKTLGPLLKRSLGRTAADAYSALTDRLDEGRFTADDAALLIIDPQRSFTSGTWMASIGDMAGEDVEPIVLAFESCAALLRAFSGRMDIMFTRCPFPPDSYNWDDRLVGLIDSKQLYFVKPGNSALFPPGNGFREWVDRLDRSGKHVLVIGGCTLNSCVRVSAIDTLIHLRPSNLQVVVDLSLCGARLRNFKPSSTWGGLSAVESAVNQMTAAGVKVFKSVKWS